MVNFIDFILKKSSTLSGKGNDKDFLQIVSGSAVTLLSKISMVMSGLGINFLVARYYGAETLGTISFLTTIVSVITIFGLFGFNTSILKLIPQAIGKDSKSIANLYRKALNIINIVSIIVSGILLLSAKFLTDNIFNKPHLYIFILVAAIVYIPNCWYEYNSSVLRAIRKVKEAALATILINFLKLFFVFLVCLNSFNADVLIYFFLFFYLLINIPFFFLVKINLEKKLNSDSKQEEMSYSDLISASSPMLITASSALVLSYLDILVISVYLPDKEVGIYSVCVKLAQVIVFILASVNAVSASKFSELFHHNKLQELKKIVSKSTRLIFFISLPVALIFIFLGKWLLGIFGEDFVTGYFSLVLLATGKLVSAACGSVGFVLNMTKYQKVYRNIVVITCIISIALNVILVPMYGMEGAAFATMISIFVNNISALVFIRLKLGFWTF